MPRTVLTAQDASGAQFPWSTSMLALTWTDADTANQNAVAIAGKMLLLARNTGASSRTITITSVADSRIGRTGDVTAQAIAAGEVRMFILVPDGWAQADDRYYFEANHTDVEFAVVKLVP